MLNNSTFTDPFAYADKIFTGPLSTVWSTGLSIIFICLCVILVLYIVRKISVMVYFFSIVLLYITSIALFIITITRRDEWLKASLSVYTALKYIFRKGITVFTLITSKGPKAISYFISEFSNLMGTTGAYNRTAGTS